VLRHVLITSCELYDYLLVIYRRVQDRSKSSGAWFKSQVLRVLLASELFMEVSSYMLHRLSTTVSLSVDCGLVWRQSSSTCVAPNSSREYIKHNACQICTHK
jgi:hypothetical protein